MSRTGRRSFLAALLALPFVRRFAPAAARPTLSISKLEESIRRVSSDPLVAFSAEQLRFMRDGRRRVVR